MILNNKENNSLTDKLNTIVAIATPSSITHYCNDLKKFFKKKTILVIVVTIGTDTNHHRNHAWFRQQNIKVVTIVTLHCISIATF